MTTATHTVLVADDHAIFRKGLIGLIDQAGGFSVVAQAQNGLEAIALYQHHQPDLLILDLQMPKLEGVAVVKAIMAMDSTANIIILTTFDTDEDIGQALKAGAKSYLLKDVTEPDLIACMHKVLAGDVSVPAQIALRWEEQAKQIQLTAREHAVLKLVAEKSLANKLIAAELGISEATVKTHLTNLFDKLGVASRTEAITVAVRRGLVRIDK
ncbi:MAG: response regulator transcription factor [Methylovulum sp.]|nr:response regulator transcription factor [Methylovulum sp.]